MDDCYNHGRNNFTMERQDCPEQNSSTSDSESRAEYGPNDMSSLYTSMIDERMHQEYESQSVVPLPPLIIGGLKDRFDEKLKRCKCRRSNCLKVNQRDVNLFLWSRRTNENFLAIYLIHVKNHEIPQYDIDICSVTKRSHFIILVGSFDTYRSSTVTVTWPDGNVILIVAVGFVEIVILPRIMKFVKRLFYLLWNEMPMPSGLS